MSQHTSFTTATTTKHQPTQKGARLIMMSYKNKMLATIALLALTIGLFSSSRSVLAVSDCQKVKGIESGVINGNTANGVITQGGRLNGTTQNVITGGFTPTPDPNTFSFTDDETITTDKGILRTHNVTLLDTANGVGSAIARIDPNASTGEFAGATGVLYLNFKSTDGGATFQEEITGEICFAN